MTLKRLLKYSLALFSLWFFIHLAILLAVGLNDQHHESDAILIFGNKVEVSGKPSKRLKSRLDEGIRLYKNGLAPIIIVSGGIGKEGFDEALVMRDYLLKMDIPEKAIITDSFGNTTHETVKNTSRLDINNLIIVSQYYHILRAKMALKKSEFKEVYSSYAKIPPELRDFYSIPREIVGYYVYLFKGYN